MIIFFFFGKQPLAEKQGKAVYDKPLWWGLSADSVHSDNLSAPSRPFLILYYIDV